MAGPGNPPVVVDETADLDRAARAIIQGGAYDNNLLCISEKEVFVVQQVFDQMMDAMERAGAARLCAKGIDRQRLRDVRENGPRSSSSCTRWLAPGIGGVPGIVTANMVGEASSNTLRPVAAFRIYSRRTSATERPLALQTA